MNQAIENFLSGWDNQNTDTPRLHRSKRDHHAIDLPRRIHIFWDQGFSSAPEIVKLCVQSWQAFNPNWQVTLYDQEAANQIVPRDTLPADMKISHYADLLRTRLLRNDGGVWVDASCICLKPLDHWLPNIFNQCAFFAFHEPGRDRLMSSWFLAASTDAVVPSEMDHIFTNYWIWQSQRSEPPPYFWFHYLFQHLAKTQPNVRQRWLQAPKISAIPVHQLKRLMTGAIKDSDRLRHGIEATPVQKLTHKQNIQAAEVVRHLANMNIKI